MTNKSILTFLLILVLCIQCQTSEFSISPGKTNSDLIQPDTVEKFEGIITGNPTMKTLDLPKALFLTEETQPLFETPSQPTPKKTKLAKALKLQFKSTLNKIENILSVLDDLGTTLLNELKMNGIDQISTQKRALFLKYNLLKVSSSDEWTVYFELLKDHTDYIRFTFVSHATHKTYATYIVQIKEGLPTKGFLAFVNHDLLNETSPDRNASRFVSIAYDTNNFENQLFIFRNDKYFQKHNRYISGNTHVEYHPTTNEYTIETIFNNTPAPDREISKLSARYYINPSERFACSSPMIYDGRENIPVEKMGYSYVTQEVLYNCQLPQPIWSISPYTIEKLPLRYFDTNTPGGTALKIVGSDTSPSQWHLMSPTSIDHMLTAEHFVF